jgi:hypothetical protein
LDEPWPLERAALEAIAGQVAENALFREQGAHVTLRYQADMARVVARENTGAGFFTTFQVDAEQRLEGLPVPVGDVVIRIDGLDHGMGFLLWIKNGVIHELEGYAQGDEDTSKLNFGTVGFAIEWV